MIDSEYWNIVQEVEISVCGFPWIAEHVTGLWQQWQLDSGYEFGPR